MKILITGKNGQVAQALLAYDKSHAAIDNLEIVSLGRPECDIRDKSLIEKAVLHHNPDIIVNAAAYTAVDKAEDEVAEAFLINRDGAKNVAEVAAKNNLPFIHLSTDYVFNGEKQQPYLEDDATGAISVYGLSKLQGEWAVAAANPNHVILRTAWVYSDFGQNFYKTMLRLAETHDALNIVCDQFGTPTHADFIAKNIIKICQQILSDTPPKNWRGIFNLVPDGQTHWADFAREIFALHENMLGKKVVVHDILSTEYKTKAKRPYYSVLDNKKLFKTFALSRENWFIYLKNNIK